MRWPRIVVCCAFAACFGLPGHGQNSTRKLRPPPSETAKRAGSAVQWRADLDAAVAEAKTSGRPVFWYVPTVKGSPMDRKPEIDRYMMAGPFSHPDVVALLNTGFVPVRERAAGAAASERGLQRGRFIEPGFLVLGPDGREQLRQDRVTTLHPGWFTARLRPLAAALPPQRVLPKALAAAWEAYAAGEPRRVEAILEESVPAFPGAKEMSEAAGWTPELSAETLFLWGAALHRTGRADRAVEVWRQVGGAFSGVPFGWKAAAEAEGHGPFAYGFEDFVAVPEAILAAPSPSTRAPAGAYTEDELRDRGLRFLVAMQQPAGNYIDSKYDFGGTDGLPNVHMAVTALVGAALLEELAADRPPGSDRLVTDAAAALERIAAYVADDAHLNRDDTDEIVWAHVYRIQLLSRWLELRPSDDERLRPVLQRIVADLQAMKPASGAWFHEYPNPFATASALVALSDARAAGVAVDADRISAGVLALLECRVDAGAQAGAFSYGQTRRGKPRASVAGAAGRMPLCELALSLWREADPQELEAAVRAAFEHHEQLESVRKYDDHANRLGYGGFFFWYDMHGRTMALAKLADAELRADLVRRQRQLILSIPEFDGCFVDSHELGRVYGTAMALWCLARLR